MNPQILRESEEGDEGAFCLDDGTGMVEVTPTEVAKAMSDGELREFLDFLLNSGNQIFQEYR